MKRLDIFCQNCYTKDIMTYVMRLKFYLYLSSKFSKTEADKLCDELALMREAVLKERKIRIKHFSMSHFSADLK